MKPKRKILISSKARNKVLPLRQVLISSKARNKVLPLRQVLISSKARNKVLPLRQVLISSKARNKVLPLRQVLISSKARNKVLPLRQVLIVLGGSIIVSRPGEINTRFLKKFRKLIIRLLKRNLQFIIVVGGGKICRAYQKAAGKIIKVPYEDMDWLGIHATRLNAHFMRTIFRKEAYPVVLDDPRKPIKNNWRVLIAAGWKPGWSTDYVSVLLAKRFKIKEIIDAGNIPFVYNKDFRKYKNTFPIKRLSWKDYRKLIGNRWIPGMGVPIDPVAAKLAQKLKIKAFIIDGTNLKNLEDLLLGRKFKGTIIT